MPHGRAAAGVAVPPAAPRRSRCSPNHGDDRRSGLYVVPALSLARARGTALDPRFAPSFSGELHAQPLYWKPAGAASGQLIVATENDTAAAIDAVSGVTVWTRRLGTRVPLSDLAGGDIVTR